MTNMSCVQELARVRWDAIETPGDDSPYVTAIRKVCGGWRAHRATGFCASNRARPCALAAAYVCTVCTKGVELRSVPCS